MSYIGTIPEELKFSKEHEWVKVDGDVATVGISDYAQHALTDVVFVELPEVGKQVEQFKALCVVESVKSVSEVFASVTGEVTEVNEELSGAPELVNQEPYEKGWMAKLKVANPDELNNLMDAAAYKAYLEGLDH